MHRVSPWTVTLMTLLGLSMGACAAASGREATNDGGTNGNDNLNNNSAITDGGADQDAAACATGSDQVVARPVDIIIIIDESPSMAEETDAVRDNLHTNMVTILEDSGLDYQVILIHSGFNMPAPLGGSSRYFPIEHGVNSSDSLTILLKTFAGFEKSPNTCDFAYDAALEWGPHLRGEAFKVFIAVTDDDPSSFDCAYATNWCANDCSGCDCSGCANSCSAYCPMHQCPTYADQPAAWGGGDFPTELANLAGNHFEWYGHRNWIFHSIVGVDQPYDASQPVTALTTVCNASGNTAETSGVEYQKLSVLTGGLRFPSCNTDYSPVFYEIAQTIIPLACTFGVVDTNVGTIDPTEVNVEYDPMDGTGAITIPQDTSAPCDSGANGWQWNADYTAIHLCGAICDQVSTNPNASVSITVGCDTIAR